MFKRVRDFIKDRWAIVTNWRCWYKWISNQLTILGTLLVSLAPDISTYMMWLVNTYGQLPMGMQMAFPEGMVRGVGIAVIILSIPARLTIQKRLPQE